jgi:hypothetical protein
LALNLTQCFETSQRITSRISARLECLPLQPDRVLRAWEEGGLLSPGWVDNTLDRLWLNVVSHMATSACLGHGLWEGLAARGVSDDVSSGAVVEAALVHDWYKRQEAELKQQARANKQDVAEATRAAERISARRLSELGFQEEIVRLARATGDVGLDRVRESSVTLAEQVVFYADCCVSGDEVVTYKERFDDLKPHYELGERYDFLDDSFLKTHGRTHREMYDGAVLPIQDRIAHLLGYKGDANTIPLAYSPAITHRAR